MLAALQLAHLPHIHASTRGEIVLDKGVGRPAMGIATGATKLRAVPTGRGPAAKAPNAKLRGAPREARFWGRWATGTAGLVCEVRGCAGCTGNVASSLAS